MGRTLTAWLHRLGIAGSSPGISIEAIMTKRGAVPKIGKRNAPTTAGRLYAPVIIVILAVLAALAVFLRQYR
jgi:hypothetical protein